MYMHASKHTCLYHAHSQFNIDKHKARNNYDKCIQTHTYTHMQNIHWCTCHSCLLLCACQYWIGYGHDVNMYVCLHACTSIYAILLQCLCCLLLPLCILVSVVVFLCLSCLLVSCMPLCILVSVVVLLVSCMSACCLFVCAFMCDSWLCLCLCLVCLYCPYAFMCLVLSSCVLYVCLPTICCWKHGLNWSYMKDNNLWGAR